MTKRAGRSPGGQRPQYQHANHKGCWLHRICRESFFFQLLLVCFCWIPNYMYSPWGQKIRLSFVVKFMQCHDLLIFIQTWKHFKMKPAMCKGECVHINQFWRYALPANPLIKKKTCFCFHCTLFSVVWFCLIHEKLNYRSKLGYFFLESNQYVFITPFPLIGISPLCVIV